MRITVAQKRLERPEAVHLIDKRADELLELAGVHDDADIGKRLAADGSDLRAQFGFRRVLNRGKVQCLKDALVHGDPEIQETFATTSLLPIIY